MAVQILAQSPLHALTPIAARVVVNVRRMLSDRGYKLTEMPVLQVMMFNCKTGDTKGAEVKGDSKTADSFYTLEEYKPMESKEAESASGLIRAGTVLKSASVQKPMAASKSGRASRSRGNSPTPWSWQSRSPSSMSCSSSGSGKGFDEMFPLRIAARALSPFNENVVCFLHDKDNGRSFGIDSIRKYKLFMTAEGVDRAIFVIDSKITPQAMGATRSILPVSRGVRITSPRVSIPVMANNPSTTTENGSSRSQKFPKSSPTTRVPVPLFSSTHAQGVQQTVPNSTQDNLASTQNTAPSSVAKSPPVCEFFMFEDLCFIVVDNEKVPKFSRVPPEQEAALLKRLKCRKSDLSRMQLNRCPIARYYAYSVGDMIRVQGPSREAGMYTTYSVIVP